MLHTWYFVFVFFGIVTFGESERFRLRGGDGLREGRLEILSSSEGWMAVCDQLWDMNSANVVCRQMGFPSAEELIKGYHSTGVKKVSMTLRNLKSICNGSEINLSQCKRHNATTPCSNQSQVGVRCSPRDKHSLLTTLRFEKTSGIIRTKGIGHMWRYVCDDDWQMKEAIVTCRTISRLNVRNITLMDNPKPRLPAITNVSCTGFENTLHACNFTEGLCNRIVTVECGYDAPDIITDLHILQRSLKVDVRAPQNLTCPREEGCLSASGYLKENVNKSRRLLTFSVMVYNIGTADLHPPTPRHEWLWHDCHEHYHSVEELATYELIGDGGVGRGHKISFCLRDSVCSNGKNLVYECDKHGLGAQGISVGCGDYYGRTLDCQWIDVTDLPDGKYLLKIRLNPSLSFSELDYENNETRCYLNLFGLHATYEGRCWLHRR